MSPSRRIILSLLKGWLLFMHEKCGTILKSVPSELGMLYNIFMKYEMIVRKIHFIQFHLKSSGLKWGHKHWPFNHDRK